MKQVRRLIVVLLLILFSGLAWLTLTTSGLHWVYQQSTAYLPGKLVAAKVQGRLIGPITLTKIEYRQHNAVIQADQIILDWQLSALLSSHINISRLHIQSLSIVLPNADKTTSSQTQSLPELKLPWRVALNDVKINDLRFKQNEQLTKLKQIRLNASSLLNQINIKSLAINTETFKLDIKGKLQPNRNYQHKLQLNWQAELPSHVTLKGNGQLLGNMQATQLKQTLSGPLQATLDAGFNDLLNQLNWQCKINISQFDTSKLHTNLPAWAGKFELDGKGDLNTASVSGKLKTDSVVAPPLTNLLDAKLNLRMSWHDKSFDIEQFDYSSSHSQFNVKGRVTDTLELDWSVAVANLAEFHPQASGQFEAQGKISGSADAPIIHAAVNGKALNLPDYKIASINANFNADLFHWQQLEFSVAAQALELKNVVLQSLDIKADSHRVHIKTISEDQVTALIEARGEVSNKTWRGHIVRADIQHKRFSNWQLKAPVALSISNQLFAVDLICWNNKQNSSACISLEEKNKTWQSHLEIKKIPLQLLSRWLPPDLKFEGVANAKVEFNFQAPDKLLGYGDINLPAGIVSYPLLEGEQDSWAYNGGIITFSLDEQGIKLKSDITISKAEQFQLDVELPGAQLLAMDYQKQAISGQAKLTVTELGLAEALIPEIQNFNGEAGLELSISGSLGQPQISGQAELRNAEFKIPRLGLIIERVSLKAQTDQQQNLNMLLEAHSGEGKLSVQAHTILDSASGWPSEIHIKGEQFKVSQIPEAQVLISPELQIKLQKNTIDIKGNIHIPYAKLQAKDITSVARVSDDAVIVGDTQAKEQKWSIFSKTRITLGDRVSFFGYGFEGRFAGSLLLEESPGQLTKATGEINIPEGRYRAYGQRLDVEHGRLLYTGGPPTNPGLDLRAVRHINNVTAGIKVRGSLNQPQMELFSIPSMGQTDTLSYLLLGRPMENASGEEGAMMAKAALALGLSGGDKLARVLGDRFGLDEMRVESSDSGDQASLVMGRYLSPRLYVSYGVGLIEAFNTFTVRYQIADKWQLKAESGEHQGADIIYTIDR